MATPRIKRQAHHPFFSSFEDKFIIKEAAKWGVQLGVGVFCDVSEVSVNGTIYVGKRLVHIDNASKQPLKMTLEEEIKRYEYECQLSLKLHHPNVVRYIGLWYPYSISSIPVLVMEKLKSLDYLLAESGPSLHLSLKVSIMDDIANGLLYLHSQSPPIMHRDLKVVTVHFSSHLVAKLSSFGSACVVTQQEEHEHLLLRHKGAYFPGSIAPEITSSNSKCDVSMDVFSFGHVALCVSNGREITLDDLLPVTFVDHKGVLHTRNQVEIREPHFKELKHQLPGGEDHPLIPLLKKCLSDDPLARPTAQEIVSALQKISDGLEDAHIAACRQAVKEKGSLDQVIMQAVMLGLPRCGKTSLKDRLVKKKVKRHTTSTGVAMKAVQVCIGKSAIQVSGTIWNELTNVNDATFMAVTEISNKLTVQNPHDQKKPTKQSSETPHEDSISTETSDISTNCGGKPLSVSGDTSDSVSNVSPMDAIQSAVEQKTINYRRLLRHLHNPWTLYITDAGGQPEFQELLPVLVSGPTLFFLVFPLHMDLHQKCMVEYLDSHGESTVPFEASFTLVENLLQSLASIASTQRFKHLESGKTFMPKVLFVGTHKDKVTPKKIKQIDEVLQVYVKQTDAYRSGIIEFATETRMLVAVNNLSESEEDVEDIRSIVHRIGTRGDDYRIPTPYPWLIFGMNINLIEKSVLTFDECFELAKKCGIETRDELNEALWFLHNYTGVVRHFQNIPDLRNIVIKDPQYVFDRVTDMIVSTFTFQRTDHHTREEFIKKGIFPLQTFQKLAQKDDSIPPQQLISLLEHLRIISPITEEGTVKKYFLPCALSHADLPPTQTTPPAIPSLYITFSSGYCPKGLFGSLVAHLMGPKKVSKFQKWELEEDQIYRNRVSFSIGPLDSFCFVFHPSYIRVDLISLPDEKRTVIPLGLVCCDVHSCVLKSIEQLMDTLHKSSVPIECSSAFACPGAPSCSGEEFHLAKANIYEGKLVSMTCLQKAKKFSVKDDLAFEFMYWFNEDAVFSHISSVASKSSPNACPMNYSRQNSPALPSQSEVFKCLLPLAHEWQNIGVLLEIESTELQRIKTDNHHQSRDCLREMTELWLKREEPPPSWEELCEAVCPFNPSKAKDIKKKHIL